MRIILCSVFLVLFATSALSQTPSASDIEAVEKELRTEKEAHTIYERARKRAAVAVQNSSLGRKMKKVHQESMKFHEEWKKCLEKWKKMEPSQWEMHNQKKMLVFFQKKDKARRDCEPLSKRSSEAIDIWMVLFDKSSKLQRKMTRKFLDDEIEKLKKRGMGQIMRDLQILKKGKQAKNII